MTPDDVQDACQIVGALAVAAELGAGVIVEGVKPGDELTEADADTSQGCAAVWRPGSHWTHHRRLRRPDCRRTP